jgi:hypothetical protein
MTETKANSQIAGKNVEFLYADPFKSPEKMLLETRQKELRKIYQRALASPGGRELTVQEAEALIAPYASASKQLQSDIEKSLPFKR